MRALYAAYRNEWQKLMKRKKYYVFLFIGLGICLFWAGLGQLITSAIRAESGGVMLFSAFTTILTPTPMGSLPFFMQLMVPFLLFMGVTDLLTVEGAENTMKAMLTRPVERWKLYAAKLLAVLTYAALYLGSVFVLSAALNQIFATPLGLLELLQNLASYVLTLIPLAILCCFASLVALLGKSGTLTMFLLLLSYLVLLALPIIFPVLSEMLFTSYLGWYKLWVGILPDPAKLLHMLLIVAAYGTVFFTAGSLLFDRKEY